ncbi:unnamed protein product, partial [Ixodes pacificus]
MLIERSHDNGNSWRVSTGAAVQVVICSSFYAECSRNPRKYIRDSAWHSLVHNYEPYTPYYAHDSPQGLQASALLCCIMLRLGRGFLAAIQGRRRSLEVQAYNLCHWLLWKVCLLYSAQSKVKISQVGAPCLRLCRSCSSPRAVGGKFEATRSRHWQASPCWSLKGLLHLVTTVQQQCNCNGHASRCHFDAAVWERSGRVSGGVCDDCRDNTMGLNCEQCVPFYYKDPQRDPSDPYACQPCDCDPRGSLDEGVCDPQDDIQAGSVAGRCHCKKNVESRRCDRCKRGHFNFQAANPDGCEPCSCHELGTAGDGCNVYTGECTCKRNVIGRDCNQCLPEYWGLGNDEDGCKPCDCDPGGAYENSCDVVTGQCRCRPSVQGRRCDQPDTGFFVGNMDYMVYEAELAKASPDCQVLVREPYAEREATWTGLGFMQVHEDSYLEFDVTDVPTSMEYDIVFRYEPKLAHGWDEAIVTIDRQGPVDPSGPCANVISQDNRQVISFPASDRYVVVAPPVCLEKGRRYKVRITFKQYDRIVDTPSASILIDSMVLLPHINAIPFFHGTPANEYRRDEFERFRCGQAFYTVRRGSSSVPDICKKYLYSIGFYVYGGAHDCRCDAQGSHSSVCSTLGGQCQCKANVVGRNCDRCAPGTYGFGPGGCR